MAKRLYQQALEPRTLDERVRRLEHQVQELTQTVAAITRLLERQGGHRPAADPDPTTPN